MIRQDSDTIIIQNNVAYLIWGITILVFLGAGYCQSLFFNNSILDQNSNQWAYQIVSIGFALITIFFVIYSLLSHVNKVSFNKKTRRVDIFKQYLFKKIAQSYTFKEIKAIDIETTSGTDGHNYYKLFVEFEDKNKIYLKESSNRDFLNKKQGEIVDFIAQ